MKTIVKDYLFKVEDFEGPLDLLLHLVKTKKQDIKKINVSSIVDQFMKIVSESYLNLDIAGEYLVTSSYFAELKSKRYLPDKPKPDDMSKEEYERLEEQAIIKRIINYEKYKKLAVELEKLNEISGMYIEKSYEKDIVEQLKPSSLSENNSQVENLTEVNLINAALKLIERNKKNMDSISIRKKKISIEKRRIEIDEIFKRSKNKSVNFLDLFEFYDKHYISVTLLIILDLVRWSDYLISQDENNDEILISIP